MPALIGGIIGFALTESDGLLKKVSWKVWIILIFTTIGGSCPYLVCKE